MVGDTRIELVTPSMSRKCSTAELIARAAWRRRGRSCSRSIRAMQAPSARHAIFFVRPIFQGWG